MSYAKQVLSGLASLLVMLAATTLAIAPALASNEGSPEVYAPLSPDELDALVAPIALYPDELIAQVLGAATYPDQIVAASQYVKVNRNLSGDALRAQVSGREWDPAVQALTQFPSVLEQLAGNISWTSALGDAVANQQSDVMAAIQRMRARAYTNGTLKSGAEITVVQQSPTVIVIEPAKPTIVYVPSYNPTVVYGTPVVTPGYHVDPAAAAVVTFGVAVIVAAAVSSGSCGFGMTWGMGWTTSSIHCGGGRYYGNPYWRGGYYPGYSPGYRPPYYYPPPRPPYPPAGGPARPTHPIAPPARPSGPTGTRPPRPTQPIAPPAGAGGRPGAGTQPGRPSQRPSPGGGSRPAAPGTLPMPGGGTRPGGPSNLPAAGSGGRPAAPGQQPGDRSMRGYGSGTQPKPNAFSGSGGGRPQSARGNASMGGGAPARPAGGGGPRQ